MNKPTRCLYSHDRFLVETSTVSLMSDREKSVYDRATIDSIKSANLTCNECSLGSKMCPGHMTSIYFVYPIIHPLFINQLAQIVTLTCFECYQPYVGDSISNTLVEAVRNNVDFSKIITNMTKNIAKLNECTNCGHPVKKFNIPYFKIHNIFRYSDSGSNFSMPTRYVKLLLQNMKHNDLSIQLLTILGIDKHVHIEEFLPNTILVLPFRDRPSVIFTQKPGDNPLTRYYLELLKESENMKMSLPEEEINITARASNIYKRYVIGENATKSSKEFTNGIIPKIKGESGHKAILSSMKVDNAKRAVAAGHPGDCSVAIIPRAIAETTPYPELITEDNIDELRVLLKRKQLFGIIPKDSNIGGQILYPEYLFKGDVAMRPLRDGDLCFINRQPEVHGGSIIIMKVIIADDNSKTIVVNINRTDSLGLDFDGDEVNVIFGQTLRAIYEMERFFYSDQVIIKPGNSSAMIGIQFSGITSTYLLCLQQDISPTEFFRITSLLTLPPDNPLRDIDNFPVITRDATTSSSDFMISISDFIDNTGVISRSIDAGILDEDKFFLEINTFGMNYYYDVSPNILTVYPIEISSDIIDDYYTMLTDLFSNFDEYFTTLVTMLIYDISEVKIDQILHDENPITKFKIIDFVLKEHLETLYNILPSVKIDHMRNNGGVIIPGELNSYFLDDMYNPNGSVVYKPFAVMCSVIVKCKNFIVENIIGIIPGSFIFSISLPKYLNYDQSNVLIENGVLIKGEIKSTHISTSGKSILLYIAKSTRDRDNEYIEDSLSFLNILNRIAVSFYNYFGATYCLDNIIGNTRAFAKYNTEIKKMKIKAYSEIDTSLDYLLRNHNDIIPTGLEWDGFQNKILNIIKPQILKLQRGISQYVNYYGIDDFSNSGAKGRKLNNDQISYTIGDLFVGGDMYIRHDAEVLDHTTLSYTLDSYIDGFNSWIEYNQILSARNAIAMRHGAVPMNEYASSTNGIILNKTTTTEDMSTIKITGKYGVAGPVQIMVQSHYGSYGIDTTRVLSMDNGGFYYADINALAKSSLTEI